MNVILISTIVMKRQIVKINQGHLSACVNLVGKGKDCLVYGPMVETVMVRKIIA
jgi:hypothetical protein